MNQLSLERLLEMLSHDIESGLLLRVDLLLIIILVCWCVSIVVRRKQHIYIHIVGDEE